MSRISLLKSVLAVLLGLAAAGWEISVRPFLPFWLDIPAFLPLVVLLLISSTRPRAYAVAIIGAMLLQLYTLGVRDLVLLRWVLVFLVLDLLASRLLTNRSFYVAVALASLGFIFERLSSFLIGQLTWAIGISTYPWTLSRGFFWSFGWNVFLVSVGFVIVAFFTKRFSPSVSRAAYQRYF